MDNNNILYTKFEPWDGTLPDGTSLDANQLKEFRNHSFDLANYQPEVKPKEEKKNT